MNKSRLYKLYDLVEDIKKVDGLIRMHLLNEPTDIVAGQYKARKTKLIGSLIDELASPEFQSPESFNIIRKVLEKYCPEIYVAGFSEVSQELKNLEAAL